MQCYGSGNRLLSHTRADFVRYTRGFLFRFPSRKPGLTASLRKQKLGGRPAVVVASASPSEGEIFEGVYGPWSIDETDKLEVTAYRGGLSVAALALLGGTLAALLPSDDASSSLLAGYGDVLCVVGAGGIGLSLTLIHIYVTPLKRLLQVFWGLGCAGALYLINTQDASLPLYVAAHPSSVWLVGPFFAALTGLAFKEGVCYGKPESAALFFVIPTLLLGHLSGLCPQPLEELLLITFTLLFSIFASRKYTQPLKDDIGDKSVFMFQQLPESEQQRVLQRIKQQRVVQQIDSTE